MADGRRAIGAVTASASRCSPPTQSEALARLKAARNDGDLGLPTRSDRLTLGTFLAKWIVGAKTNVRASTWRRYEQLVRMQLVPSLGRLAIARLQPADLRAAYAKMLESGLAPRSVGHAHRLLGRALRDAEIAGHVGRNVAFAPPKVIVSPRCSTSRSRVGA